MSLPPLQYFSLTALWCSSTVHLSSWWPRNDLLLISMVYFSIQLHYLPIIKHKCSVTHPVTCLPISCPFNGFLPSLRDTLKLSFDTNTISFQQVRQRMWTFHKFSRSSTKWSNKWKFSLKSHVLQCCSNGLFRNSSKSIKSSESSKSLQVSLLYYPSS